VARVDSDNKDPPVTFFKLGDGSKRSGEHVRDVVSIDKEQESDILVSIIIEKKDVASDKPDVLHKEE
jgi:hypothetical protein